MPDKAVHACTHTLFVCTHNSMVTSTWQGDHQGSQSAPPSKGVKPSTHGTFTQTFKYYYNLRIRSTITSFVVPV